MVDEESGEFISFEELKNNAEAWEVNKYHIVIYYREKMQDQSVPEIDEISVPELDNQADEGAEDMLEDGQAEL